MSTSYLTHTLEKDRDQVLVSSPSESLALLDLESYPAFIGKGTDYFDLMAHLSSQMRALTVMAWKAPTLAFNFALQLAGDDRLLEQTPASRSMIASGNVRCYGQLCLTTHERLFDAARHRAHTLLRKGHMPKIPVTRLLNVPPGIYSIYVYYHGVFPRENHSLDATDSPTRADYTVLLRHYPFPPKRVAPVRLSGLSALASVEALGQAAGNVITSHWPWEKYNRATGT